MVEMTSNQGSSDVNDMIDVNNVEDGANDNIDKAISIDSSVDNIQNDLAEIEWQRSEDGSYSPSSYINRDLSLLQFHLRVLAQASSSRHPLLERLFFLIIFSSNLDEFFEIRVAGIMQKLNIGDISTSAHGMRPSEVLNEISIITHAAISEQYRILNEDILPALALEDIRYLKRDELNAEQSAWMKRYFTEQVVPVLTPISIDPAHPFPRLVNKSLNFIATLELSLIHI